LFSLQAVSPETFGYNLALPTFDDLRAAQRAFREVLFYGQEIPADITDFYLQSN